MIQNPILFWPRKKNCLSEQKDFHKNVFISEKNIFGKYYISCFQRKKLFHVWKKSFKCILKKSVFSPEINCVLCFFFSCVYDSRTGEIFFFFSESLYLFFFFFKSVGSFTCFHKCIITIIRKCNCIVLFIISFSNLNLNCGVNYKFRDGWCWINGKTLLMNAIQKKSFHYNNMNGQVALLIKK